MRKYIVDQIDEAINVQNMMLNDSKLIDRINLAAEKCVSSIKSGNKILLAGNGGSAADSQHIR